MSVEPLSLEPALPTPDNRLPYHDDFKVIPHDFKIEFCEKDLDFSRVFIPARTKCLCGSPLTLYKFKHNATIVDVFWVQKGNHIPQY